MNNSDPSGLFPESMILKNLSINDFSYKNPYDSVSRRERWGFYALLLDAQEYDYVRVGMLDLFQLPYPEIWYSKTERVLTINCDTIMIGSKTLSEYYQIEVKKQRSPTIWWRDTSARYYQLLRSSEFAKTYVDGSSWAGFNWSDYPDYHSLSAAFTPFLGFNIEVNVIVDINGHFHLSFGTGNGQTYGVAYTEGYLCKTSLTCLVGSGSQSTLMPSEVTAAMRGLCVNSGLVLLAGLNISYACNDFHSSSFTSATTFYAGLQAGYNKIGGTLTLTLPYVQPRMGWSKELNDELNGVTLADILSK